MRRLAAALGLVAAATACGDDPTFRGDADAVALDTSDDAFDVADAVSQDAESDATGTAACGAATVLGEALALHPDGATTQIHVDAAFDGGAVWTVHNTRGANDDFDVWLTRVGCDGTVVRLPAQVDSQDGPGAIEPQIVVNRHGVLVAYQTDTPGAEHNLDLVARSFTPDGAPFDAVERVLELSRDGEPNPGNAWMPTLTATQDAFAIAAAWGHDDAPAFQVLLQDLTAYGVPTGDAVDVALAPAAGQIYPSVASNEDAAVVAWVQQEEGEPDTVYVARIGGRAFDATPLATRPAGPPSVAVFGQSTVVATSGPDVAGGSNVTIYAVAEDGTLSDGASIGDPALSEHTPRVALWSETHGAALYYRTITGFQNELWLATFELVDGVPTVVTNEQITTDAPVAPYTPAITPVGEGAYFIAWSEGQSPDFRVHFRFVAP